MQQAVIYTRVSSRDQETEGFSIPAQLKALNEYALKHGYSVAREFTDVETAKRAGRTQFTKMLAFLEQNPSVRFILVEKTDRLLRNIADYALIDRLIEYSNITIHLIKENVVLGKDSRSNEKFIFGIKALMAKNYVDNLSEEVRKGMIEKASQGTFPSHAPFGYINARDGDRKIIAIDKKAAPFVKKMFEFYATGTYSLKTLRKKMLDEGLIYRSGKNFHVSTLETILKNEFYTGIFYWRGKRYENASHEAIISKALYHQVQDTLLHPKKDKSKKGLFTYTNLIRCGVCGCKLTAEIKKGKYIYYHCTGQKGYCMQSYLRQEQIDLHFEQLLAAIQVNPSSQEIILKGLRDSMQDKIEYHNHLASQFEQQIKLLQNRIDQAYLDKLDGKITELFWQEKTKKWVAEKDTLYIKLLALQKADTHYLESVSLAIELANKASNMFKDQGNEGKKRLINLLIGNCTYKDGKIDSPLKPIFHAFLKFTLDQNWWS
ncbi:MAG: recombinase family protein [Candidatus Dependentiae bacterium]|nr:recombinase family protein [Candidatus Dependentiae bacterium]